MQEVGNQLCVISVRGESIYAYVRSGAPTITPATMRAPWPSMRGAPSSTSIRTNADCQAGCEFFQSQG